MELDVGAFTVDVVRWAALSMIIILVTTVPRLILAGLVLAIVKEVRA